MMIVWGCLAFAFAIGDFIAAWNKFKIRDKEGGRWDSLECAIWFTAAMICFK